MKARLCCVVLSVLAGCTEGCTEGVDEVIDRADKLLFDRRYAEAARAFEQVLSLTSELGDDAALAQRQRSLMRLGEIRTLYLLDPQGALRAYRAAAETANGDQAFDARLRVVRVLADRVGDLSQAASELGALLQSFPKRAESERLRLEHAQLLFRLGRYPAALESAKLLDATENLAVRLQAKTLMATLHEVEGRPEAALSVYQDLLAMELDPATRANVLLEQGHALETLGRFDEARARYESARIGATDAALVEERLRHLQARIDAQKAPRRAAPTGDRRYVGGITVIHGD